MSTPQNIQNSILKAIDTIAQRRVDQLKLDKTITAIINSSVGVINGRKVYKVEYEGGYFNATAQNKDDAYLPRMAVYVQVPEGNFSNEKFILGKASALATDAQVSVVAATANNYSIVGKNIITNKVDEIGVYSYHDPKSENSGHSISHRFNFIYQKDNLDNLVDVSKTEWDLYKKEASALMIRADFMTKLTQEQKQKATGEYGLIFNLSFHNMAAGIAETQGEIFDILAPQISITDDQLENINLKSQDSILIDYLEHKTFDNLVVIDGYLDQLISTLQEIDRVYQNNNPEKYTDTVQDLINKYTIMVEDIKRASTIAEMKQIREDWMSEIVSQPAEKQVSYYLSSNDMIGNPFSFSSWMSQYAVFEIDLENFIGVDSILLYKQGFIEDEVKESVWRKDINEDFPKPDILVKDIQMYAMRPLSDNAAGYQLKVEDEVNGMIFNGDEIDKELTVKATLLREYFEDLSRNADTTFYWFKQSSDVVSPSQSEYNIYGGVGWQELYQQNSYKLIIKTDDVPAYENHFRCAAVYIGEETPIVLRYDFIIYNLGGRQFKLESDLGTDFTFDAGVPTIKLLNRANDEEEWEELYLGVPQSSIDKQYQTKWAIIDGNNQKAFLNEKAELDLTSISIANYSDYTNTSKLLKDIEWYCGEDDVTNSLGDKVYTTRLKYPMSNVGSSSTVTFECYISYRKSIDTNYYLLGKAVLTLNNFKTLTASAYRIYIENGDQVFQYDEYGDSPAEAKHKDPQKILPIKAHLFAPNNIEIQDTSFRVKWFFPTNESMIEYSGAEQDPATGAFNLFKGSEIGFNIKSIFDYNAIDNQIKCQIDFNDQTLYSETTFNFTKVGNNGTNGTDVISKIVPKVQKNIYINQPFTLYVNGVGKVFCNGDIPASDQYNNLKTYINLNDYLDVELYQKSQKIENGYITRWNIAGNTSSANNKHGKYIEINSDYTLTWKSNNTTNKYNQFILKAESVFGTSSDKRTYYSYYNLPVIFYNIDRIPLQENARIAINRDTYLKEVLYNSDGRNPLYNHNQGLELINLPSNVKEIRFEAKGGYANSESEPCFTLLKDEVQDDVIITGLKNAKVYILPDDEFKGAITNNYIKATIYNESDIIIAIVYAPIHMSLNTFGLASLNAWDGNTININEEERYIMAPQIGAGYKEINEGNLFTGVVMGQVNNFSNNSEHQYTGLMGFKRGTRSFFLDAENGNAFFGTPSIEDGVNKEIEKAVWDASKQKYEIRRVPDYNEGLIELKPGEESIIGGWRLGRRSLYYITDNTTEQLQDISEAYSDAWARKAEHERDIGRNHRGILLNAAPLPYISIKGKPLTVGVPDATHDYDINNKSGNAALSSGDSLELNLDPNQKDFFTIFRHFKQNNIWDREPLVGIDALGRFYTNALKDKETSLNMNYVAGFGYESVYKRYVGLNVAYGSGTIIKNFIIKDAKDNDTLYISGGILNNEYERPISIHGNSISLYAYQSGRETSTTTNNYIKVSNSRLDGYSGSAGFTFYSSSSTSNNSSITSTNGLSINAGLSGSRKAFALTTGSQNIQAIDNSISVTSKGYTLNSSAAIDINTTASNSDITLTRNSGSKIEIGYNSILSSVDSDHSIKLSNNATNIWKTNQRTIKLQIDSVANNAQIVLSSESDVSGIGRSGMVSSKDSTGSQILIQAGTHTRLGMTSSNNNFTASSGDPTGYPMYWDFGNNIGHLDVRVANTGGTNIKPRFYIGMSAVVDKGLRIEGKYESTADYGLYVKEEIQTDNGFWAERADDYTFNYDSISRTNDDFTSTADGYNLNELIYDCLYAINKAKKAANDAMSQANDAWDYADKAMSQANDAMSQANDAYSLADSKVDKSTYNNHTHSFSASKTATFSKNVSVSDISDIYAMYDPEEFYQETEGDNVIMRYETFPEQRADRSASQPFPRAIGSFQIYGADDSRDISITDTVSVSGTSGKPSPQIY